MIPIDRYRRKKVDEALNEIETRAFRSVNSSIGWIGSNVSLFCAFYSNWLQQKTPSSRIEELISQINTMKLLKKLGTITHYKNPEKGDYKLSVLVFADGSRKGDHGQLCLLSELLFGSIFSGSVFHIISWSSRKSRRPLKSVASAETLGAVEAIDEIKVTFKAYNELLIINIGLWTAVHSEDFFNYVYL